MTTRFTTLDRTRKLDRAPEQQHLFGHGGFARIRVGNDSESTAASSFLLKFGHGIHRVRAVGNGGL